MLRRLYGCPRRPSEPVGHFLSRLSRRINTKKPSESDHQRHLGIKSESSGSTRIEAKSEPVKPRKPNKDSESNTPKESPLYSELVWLRHPKKASEPGKMKQLSYSNALYSLRHPYLKSVSESFFLRHPLPTSESREIRHPAHLIESSVEHYQGQDIQKNKVRKSKLRGERHGKSCAETGLRR